EKAIIPMTSQSNVDRLAEQFRDLVTRGDLVLLRLLLQEHASARDLLNAPIFPYDSPSLVFAAGTGNLPLIDLLLEFGGDPNRRSDWWAGGFHPLHIA